MAQDAATPAPAQAAETAQDYDIIVTARRREENLQDVPLAVSVLNSAAIERQNIVDLASMGSRVPGLVVANSLGGGRSTPTFAIRGQSQQELSGIADPSVSLYINDVVVPRAQGANTGFFDIASVEVAKGPQGTLFGRNTTGGAIIVRTHRPEDQFGGYISQMIGNLGAFTTEAMINVPLGDIGAFRIAGIHMERDGYLEDVLRGRDINTVNEDAIRGSLTLHLSDRLTNDTTVQYANSDNGGTGGYVTFSLSPLFAPALAARQNLGFYETESGVPAFTRVDNLFVDNATTFEINDQFTIKNLFGYREVQLHSLEDLDGSASLLFPVERIVDQHQVSNEIQLQGSFDRFDFILGAYYFRENSSDQALTAGALSGSGAVDPGALEPDSILAYAPRYSNTWVQAINTSYAIFFQGNLRITDALSVTAGLRQNWDERQAVIRNRAYIAAVSTTDLSCRFTLDLDNNPATPETRPPLSACAFTGEASFNELTYNLSAQYEFDNGVLAYVAHRHGYRSGGFGARGNSQATLGDTFDPEMVDDYEIGLKADWHFGDMFLRTNVALFRADYSDMQRILIQNPPGSAPVTLTTNAGSARIEGAELEFIFRPTRIFELSGFYAYTDAGFRQYIGPNGDDLSGQIFPRAPRHSYSLTAQLMPQLPDGAGDLRFGVTYRYQSAYDYNDDYALERTLAGVALPNGVLNNQAQIIESQGTWSANAEWNGVLGSSVDLSAFVENLTGEKYLVPYMGIVGAYETRTPVAPRTFGVRARFRF